MKKKTIDKTSIASDIRAVRASLGISQRKLAALIPGLTRQNIADWETSRSRVSAEAYLKIMALRPEGRQSSAA